MKKRFYIALLALCSCSVQVDFPEENKAIFGIWVAGEAPYIKAVFFENNEYRIAENERFEILFSDGEKGFFTFYGDTYQWQSQRLPQPGERVQLNWLLGSDTARVDVEYPPQATITGIVNDTLMLSESASALIQWSAPANNVEFALELQCVENQPLPLPGGQGNFEALHSGPQVSSQIELGTDAFSFYGSHKLSISVLNDELVDFFFFDQSDIRGLLKNGPDNVIGGKGFITAISTTDVPLEIE